MASGHAKSTPIFWGQGQDDQLVTLQMANASVDFLKNQVKIPDATSSNVRGIEYKVYKQLGHSTTPEELANLRDWIIKIIP